MGTQQGAGAGHSRSCSHYRSIYDGLDRFGEEAVKARSAPRETGFHDPQELPEHVPRDLLPVPAVRADIVDGRDVLEQRRARGGGGRGRGPGAEQALLGVRPCAAAAAAARAALLEDIAPIDDIRSDRDYRRLVSGNVLEQFLRASEPRFAAR